MKVLYIDESGVPELSDRGKYVILCGVLIDEEDEKSISFIMERLKQEYKLDTQNHLHAVDLFENPSKKCFLGPARQRRQDLRKEFQKAIWDLIKYYNIEYFAVKVSKDFVVRCLKLHKKSDQGKAWFGNKNNLYAKIDRQLPMDVGANAIYHWAIKKCREEEKLKIVFESRSGDQFTVRNFEHIHSGGESLHNQYLPVTNPVAGIFKNPHIIRFANLFRKNVVSLAFANKHVKYVGLELADIICFTCNVYFLQNKTTATPVRKELVAAIKFPGIHKTLNKKHYTSLGYSATKKYIPGIKPRTRRIARFYYHSSSPSPAMAGARVP